MKKKLVLLLIFCLFVLCLSGCERARPLCTVVTSVDIACDHDGLPIRRHYTDFEKMEAVLLYLRLLRPGGAPKENPDKVDGDVYEITVSLSNGNRRVYRQKAHRYFQQSALWQSIAPEKAAGLYGLMRYYPSDL